MARLEFHSVVNNLYATLNATINSAVTSLVVSAATADYPTVPFKVDIDSEILRVSAVALDTPSAGLDTLTVARAQDGTTAASHTAAARASQNPYASQVSELQFRNAAMESALVASFGGGEGVPGNPAGTQLKVVAQGSPGMTVVYTAGACIVSGQFAWLYTNTNSSTFTAPVGNPRKDTIQISQLGVVSAKTGTPAGSPSAPAVDTDCYKLAEIYHRVAETSIKNTDDASNGYITDFRTFI